MKNIYQTTLGVFFIFFSFLSVLGQTKPLDIHPSQENTYLFKILRYNRQPKIPSYIGNRVAQILQNPKSEWTAQDSLYFAYKNVYLQNYPLALSVFSKLNTDTIREHHAQSLYRATLQQLSRYKDLKRYNEKTFPEDTSAFYSIKDAFMDLTDAYIAYNKNEFIPDSSQVFPVLHQEEILNKVDPKAPPYKNKLVQVAFAIDSAFRQFTFLHDEKDVILSEAFEEMGDFQKQYLYITNAYFYYAGALHYNKNNRFIIDKYNRTIDDMTSNNYLSISFKHKFGKILKKRYNLDEESTQTSEIDSLPAKKASSPPIKEERKDYFPWLDTSVLILIILAGMLIFILFFVRTKKK